MLVIMMGKQRKWERVNISIDRTIARKLELKKIETGVPISRQIEKALKDVIG